MGPKIETLPNKNRKKKFVSYHTYSELTAVCPTTRLPDFYTLKLAYESDKLLPELKSLKFYFLSFRNREILHEELANEILDDFVSAVNPRWVQLILKVNNRGGVFTTIGRRWNRERGDEAVDLEAIGAD